MAKVRKNIFIRGLDGDLGGQFLVRTGKISGRTSVFAKIDCDHTRVDSPAQEAQKQDFREASVYAESNQDNPVYIAKAGGKQDKERQPKNVAMADWFQPPQILEIDLRGWRGCPGDVIRVLAVDDVQVAGVKVEITDEAGALLETGPAVLAVTQRWEYTLKEFAFRSPDRDRLRQGPAGARDPGQRPQEAAITHMQPVVLILPARCPSLLFVLHAIIPGHM